MNINYVIIFLLCIPSLCLAQEKNVNKQHVESSYLQQQATVRIANSICDDEKIYIAKRKSKVKDSLEQLLQMNISHDEIPTIAFCGSGGGCRATISMLGCLSAINVGKVPKKSTPNIIDTIVNAALAFYEQLYPATITSEPDTYPALGLLDICTYAAGVSGSAWGLAALLQSHKRVDDYLTQLTESLNEKHLLDDVNLEEVIASLLKKYSYQQPMTLIDLYGAILAQKMLKNSGNTNPNAIDLAAQQLDLVDGSSPFPIYTAVTGNTPSYCWIEFNPYEIGSVDLNAFIPCWAFGRQFNNGISIDLNPPQTLGFGLGVWGSGVTADIKEFFEIYVKPETGEIIDNYFGNPERTALVQNSHLNSISDYRLLSPAKVHNWTYNLPTAGLNDYQYLTLIDAGLDNNLPLIPLLNRNRSIDIMIIFDAGFGEAGTQLLLVQQYAQKHNIPFPVINSMLLNQICSVHHDVENPHAPLIIYFPLMRNSAYLNGWDPYEQSFSSTFNFHYTAEQVQQLSGLATFNVQSNQTIIVETIRQWILDRKSQKH